MGTEGGARDAEVFAEDEGGGAFGLGVGGEVLGSDVVGGEEAGGGGGGGTEGAEGGAETRGEGTEHRSEGEEAGGLRGGVNVEGVFEGVLLAVVEG